MVPFNGLLPTASLLPLTQSNLYNSFAVLRFTCTKNLFRAFVKQNCFGLA